MIEDMMHMASRHSGRPIGLLVVAGLLREDAPWLYEPAMELYRATRTGTSKEIEEALRAFEIVIEMTMHGPLAEELVHCHN